MAACVDLTTITDYHRLANQMDDLLERTALTEWSSRLVDAADVGNGAMLLPLWETSVADDPQHPFTAYARRFTSLLNHLNRAMMLDSTLLGSSPIAQVSSVEFTFQLRPEHERHLILHRDNRVHDSRSALFIVSLRNGSMPTVLSSDPLTSSSDELCSDASDGGPIATCASDRAGSASYLPLHVCHARPPATASSGRRDVVAVHVRWSEEPPAAAVLARMVHEIASLDLESRDHGSS